jgi:hypothetical protein
MAGKPLDVLGTIQPKRKQGILAHRSDWDDIRKDWEGGLSPTECSRKYNVSKVSVYDHIRNDGWIKIAVQKRFAKNGVPVKVIGKNTGSIRTVVDEQKELAEHSGAIEQAETEDAMILTKAAANAVIALDNSYMILMQAKDRLVFERDRKSMPEYDKDIPAFVYGKANKIATEASFTALRLYMQSRGLNNDKPENTTSKSSPEEAARLLSLMPKTERTQWQEVLSLTDPIYLSDTPTQNGESGQDVEN